MLLTLYLGDILLGFGLFGSVLMYLHTVLKQRMVKVCSPLKIGNSVLAILRFEICGISRV